MIIKGHINKKLSRAYLICELGKFIIKNSKEYPEGETRGFFELVKLSPASASKDNVIHIAIEAELGQVILDNLLGTMPQSNSITNTSDVDALDTEEETELSLKQRCEEAELPYPLPSSFVVDTSISRSLISRQNEVLKSAGYTFIVETQQWQDRRVV